MTIVMGYACTCQDLHAGFIIQHKMRKDGVLSEMSATLISAITMS